VHTPIAPSAAGAPCRDPQVGRAEGVGDGARVVIFEGAGLAPERDVDRERDLLDRTIATEPVRAQVARQVEELRVGEVGGGRPVEDLLIGGVRGQRWRAVLADERLDRRPVDDVERIERLR